jgi:hypothetical protein
MIRIWVMHIKWFNIQTISKKEDNCFVSVMKVGREKFIYHQRTCNYHVILLFGVYRFRRVY